MNWEREKIILSIIGIVLFGLMVFLFGVAFGTSTNEANFRQNVLPILDVVGSWVSGVGALGAVLVALWIAEQQRRTDKENLKIDFAYVYISGINECRLMVSAVCDGRRPSEVNSIAIYGQNSDTVMGLFHFEHFSNKVPLSMSYGKKATWILIEEFSTHIGAYINKYCGGLAERIVITVNTTTESFSHKPNSSMIARLQSYADAQKLNTENETEK